MTGSEHTRTATALSGPLDGVTREPLTLDTPRTDGMRVRTLYVTWRWVEADDLWANEQNRSDTIGTRPLIRGRAAILDA